MILEAEAQGLKTHQMGGYDDAKLVEAFNVPKEFDSISVMALGYQAEPDVMPEDYKEAELKQRERLPLGETFFDSSWGNPII
jgi:nitroreductase